MYKKYKVTSGGDLKFNEQHYKVAPERRFNKHTDEWQRRLEKEQPLYQRRKPKKTSSIKVREVFYVIAIIILMLVIKDSNIFKSNSASNNTMLNTTYLNSQNVTITNITCDFGDRYSKPSQGYAFLHLNIDVNNDSSDVNNVKTDDFTLVDAGGNVFNSLFLDNNANISSKEIGANSILSSQVTFEIPLGYKGEVEVFYNSDMMNSEKRIGIFNLK